MPVDPVEEAQRPKPLRRQDRFLRSRTTFVSRNQTVVNFWLDTLLLICFLAQIWGAVIVRFVFPPASAAAGYALWGMSFGDWLDIQFVIQVCFSFGILLHLMLHWNWVCGVISSRILRVRDGRKRILDDGQRTILGVGFLIVVLNVLGVGIAVARLSIQIPM